MPLRRVKYHDKKTGKTFNFLTNDLAIPTQAVADLYRSRWQVELFFKWIKQRLCIKRFFGTSKNAIIKKRFDMKAGHYTILQILSLTF